MPLGLGTMVEVFAGKNELCLGVCPELSEAETQFVREALERENLKVEFHQPSKPFRLQYYDWSDGSVRETEVNPRTQFFTISGVEGGARAEAIKQIVIKAFEEANKA